MYKAKLETLGETYEGKGKTAVEALQDIDVSYLDIKGKGTITLNNGKKESSRFMYAKPLKKAIANKMTRIGLASNLEKLLKGEDTEILDKAVKPLKIS